jgi:hypothetical protein
VRENKVIPQQEALTRIESGVTIDIAGFIGQDDPLTLIDGLKGTGAPRRRAGRGAHAGGRGHGGRERQAEARGRRQDVPARDGPPGGGGVPCAPTSATGAAISSTAALPANHNPNVATCADYVIAQVETLFARTSPTPSPSHTQGIYVDAEVRSDLQYRVERPLQPVRPDITRRFLPSSRRYLCTTT